MQHAATDTGTIDIAPTPFQARVLSLPMEWDLLLDGGRGGGKTYCVILEVFRRAERWGARSRTLITRRTQGALSELEHELLAIFRLRYGTAARHNANEHVFRLPNGAYVELRNLEGQRDLLPLQGKSFDCIVAEEVGQYADLSLFDFLRGCLRSPSGVPCRFIMTANPGGPGHAVIAKRFIFRREAWVPVLDKVSGRTYVRCPSTLDDNPRLPSDYAGQMRAIASVDPGLYEAWRSGDWTAVAGDYFGGVFDEARNILPPPDPADRPFDAPLRWEVRLSCDWGTTAPACVLFGAISPGASLDEVFLPRGSVFLFDEVHTAMPDDLNRGSRAGLGGRGRHSGGALALGHPAAPGLGRSRLRAVRVAGDRPGGCGDAVPARGCPLLAVGEGAADEPAPEAARDDGRRWRPAAPGPLRLAPLRLLAQHGALSRAFPPQPRGLPDRRPRPRAGRDQLSRLDRTAQARAAGLLTSMNSTRASTT